MTELIAAICNFVNAPKNKIASRGLGLCGSE